MGHQPISARKFFELEAPRATCRQRMPSNNLERKKGGSMFHELQGVKIVFSMISLLVVVTALPASASLVIKTNTSSPTEIDVFVSEHVQGGLLPVNFLLGNDNVPLQSITIDAIVPEAPLAIAGDTLYDVLNGAFLAGADQCKGKTLVPDNNPFQNPFANCSSTVTLQIGDADTTDKKNPVVDQGEWQQRVDIDWTRQNGTAFQTILTIDVQIQDDNTAPEPSTWLLMATSFVAVVGRLWQQCGRF
jgi:hypothetical protein